MKTKFVWIGVCWLALFSLSISMGQSAQQMRRTAVGSALRAQGAASGFAARHGLTSERYQATFNDLAKAGYRILHVDAHVSSGHLLYAGIWEKRQGPALAARHGLSPADFQSEFTKLGEQGYRLVHVDGCGVGNSARFSGIWEKRGGPPMVARHGLSAAAYQEEFTKLTKDGYRLVRISGYSVGGKPFYAAIWEKKEGPALKASHGLSAAAYQTEFNTMTQAGYRLTWVDCYAVGSSIQYAAIFEKRGGLPWLARHAMSGERYQGEFSNQSQSGYRLLVVNGAAAGNSSVYAALWENEAFSAADLQTIDSKVQALRQDGDSPGVSVAITKNGRLVFAKGYGFADTSDHEIVDPRHRFRVASISKSITSVAVMSLVQQGKLTLNRKVFGQGGVLGTKFGTKSYSDRVKAITVQHLLEHTHRMVMLESNNEVDPMFRKLGYDHAKLIGWVLDDGEVAAEPGQQYSYSNFGYCVLGRVIEQVTGQSYEKYVRSVLGTADIQRMEIGGATLAQRKNLEVVYYGSSAYGLLPWRMDAHGGWIATPSDLLRLTVRVDQSPTKGDILNDDTLKTMFTKTTARDTQGNGVNYAKGWTVGSVKGHNGAMGGTSSVFGFRADGYAFAIFRNNWPSNDKWSGDASKTMNAIIDAVSKWPGYDLF